MIRTLSLASVIALLPAATVAQEMTDSELHTKSVEAEKATATMAQALVIGLADGVQAPSVTLVDTTGTTQTFEALAGTRGTVVAFVRSADWCPYCKKQLTDLEDMKPGSRYEGIPHPAIMFIGADGRIEKTLREDGYKNRPAIDLVIETAEGL